MSRYFTADLAGLDPYTPGEQPQGEIRMKLNTNENPFPPSSRVAQAITREQIDSLRLYEDPDSALLRQAAAKRYGLAPEQIVAGNGSDEILMLAIRAFCGEGKGLAFPNITYGFYKVWAALFGIDAKEIPLAEDFSIRPADYAHLGRTMVIANPNAPSGLVLTPAQIEEILRANPDDVLILDEAYVDFGAESCLPLLDKYDNLLVVHTFSKSRSLAGGRLGFGFGCPALIEDLNRVRYSMNPYNVNLLTQLAGIASLEDEDYFRACVDQVCDIRDKTAAALRQLGFIVTDSRTNFLFVRTDKMPGARLFDRLRQQGIVVRRWNDPLIADWLRISIGTREQMEQLVEIIRGILEE